jgi:hypothetical protein
LKAGEVDAVFDGIAGISEGPEEIGIVNSKMNNSGGHLPRLSSFNYFELRRSRQQIMALSSLRTTTLSPETEN